MANELNPLFSLPLEELMNVEVSLTSRSEESQFTAPSAVYVLTQEDIRRSGLRRIPEILRMVPGLHVAKIDANKWTVSSRNNQSRFSSSMQVILDGRNIYSPFYAGVYWENQDIFIEDIERIEIVRGPGGSLWGTNAVDGIINIITKSSADTHGIKAFAVAGQGEMKYETGFRYGGASANGMNYRVFAKQFKTDTGEYLKASESTNDGLAPVGNDEGKSKQIGFRTDWASGQNNFALQGKIQDSDFDEDRATSGQLIPNSISSKGQGLAMSWKRQLNNTDSLSVTSFYSQLSRDDDILENDENTFDIDLQHNLTLGKHKPVWGVGFRYYYNKASVTNPNNCSSIPCFGVDPETKRLETWNAFVQDRISLTDTFTLVVGTKFEDNEYTSFEYQPTLRGIWTPDNNTTYWSAITRALRIPDRVNTDGTLNFGIFTIPIGDKDAKAVISYIYELGYRKCISTTLAVDGSAFYNNYDNAIQGTAVGGRDYIYGFEGNIKKTHSNNLRTELGYTYNDGRWDVASGDDTSIARLIENTLYAKSYFQLKKNMELDTMIYYVSDSKTTTGARNIPEYTRVDVHYGWQANNQFDVSVLLSNLLDNVHAEGYDSFKINTGSNRCHHVEADLFH